MRTKCPSDFLPSLIGDRTVLMVCQTMSIAMIVVSPTPVAIFMAIRMSSGVACSFAPKMCSQIGAYRYFGEPYDGCCRRMLDSADDWMVQSAILAIVGFASMKETSVEIRTADGAMPAFVCVPDVAEHCPGVVVYMDVFGPRKEFYDICRRFATCGYTAILPQILLAAKNRADAAELTMLKTY